MTAILNAVGSMFAWLFNPTGEGAVPAITTVVNTIVNNDYLLVGLALMIVGSVIGFLSRIIHST